MRLPVKVTSKRSSGKSFSVKDATRKKDLIWEILGLSTPISGNSIDTELLNGYLDIFSKKTDYNTFFYVKTSPWFPFTYTSLNNLTIMGNGLLSAIIVHYHMATKHMVTTKDPPFIKGHVFESHNIKDKIYNDMGNILLKKGISPNLSWLKDDQMAKNFICGLAGLLYYYLYYINNNIEAYVIIYEWFSQQILKDLY